MRSRRGFDLFPPLGKPHVALRRPRRKRAVRVHPAQPASMGHRRLGLEQELASAAGVLQSLWALPKARSCAALISAGTCVGIVSVVMDVLSVKLPLVARRIGNDISRTVTDRRGNSRLTRSAGQQNYGAVPLHGLRCQRRSPSARSSVMSPCASGPRPGLAAGTTGAWRACNAG